MLQRRAAFSLVLVFALFVTGCSLDGSGNAQSVVLDKVAAATILVESEGAFADVGSGEIESSVQGSGFFIDSSGIAVTANHVVSGAAIIRVFVPGENQPRSAQVIGTSECSDFALIKVEGDDFPTLSWFTGDLAAGDEIYAAGYGGGNYTLTRGIVSQVEIQADTEWTSIVGGFEHDARTSPGSSGGPVISSTGEVVGVTYALSEFFSQSWAIGAQVAEGLVERIELGEETESVGLNAIALVDSADDDPGVWVTSVEPGSAAFEAGVEAGDVVSLLNGISVGREGILTSYCEVLRSTRPNQPLPIQIYRASTDQILEGALRGEALEEKFSFAGSGGDADQNDYQYVPVADDTGRIYVETPAAWRFVDGAPYDLSGNEVFDLIVAEDGFKFTNYTFDTSGVRISASYDVARILDEVNVLEAYYDDYGTVCSYDSTEEYEDSLYYGEYDVYLDCGGTGTAVYVVAVVPNNRAFVIWIEAQVRSDADLLALDQVLATFFFE